MSVPGSEYLYSTHGFTLLAAVIEKVTGVPFNKVSRPHRFSAEYEYRDFRKNFHQSGILGAKGVIFSQLS
jgi:hypothetical protein